MPFGFFKSMAVRYFKIDQTGPARVGVVQEIAQVGISMGPATVEDVAPQAVDASEFASRRRQHRLVENSPCDGTRQVIPRHLFRPDGVVSVCKGPIPFTSVKKGKRMNLPCLPRRIPGPNRDRIASGAEEQIGEKGNRTAPISPLFDPKNTIPADFLAIVVNSDAVNQAADGLNEVEHSEMVLTMATFAVNELFRKGLSDRVTELGEGLDGGSKGPK